MTAHDQALHVARQDPGTVALANCIRTLSIDAMEADASRHPGAPMGLAMAATVLWTRHLKFDAAPPGILPTASHMGPTGPAERADPGSSVARLHMPNCN